MLLVVHSLFYLPSFERSKFVFVACTRLPAIAVLWLADGRLSVYRPSLSIFPFVQRPKLTKRSLLTSSSQADLRQLAQRQLAARPWDGQNLASRVRECIVGGKVIWPWAVIIHRGRYLPQNDLSLRQTSDQTLYHLNIENLVRPWGAVCNPWPAQLSLVTHILVKEASSREEDVSRSQRKEKTNSGRPLKIKKPASKTICDPFLQCPIIKTCERCQNGPIRGHLLL